MPDDNLTSVEEPVEPQADVTSDTGPDDSTEQVPTGEAAAPTVEDLQKQNERLRANLKGRQSEAERERARARELEQTLARYQTAPAPAPAYQPPAELSDEELGKLEQNYLVEGKYQEVGQHRRKERERTIQEAENRITRRLADMAIQAQSAQSVQRFLAKHGLTDPQNPDFQVARRRMDEMNRDPDYAWAQGNPATLAALAAQEISYGKAARKGAATEKARSDSSEGAGTEPPKPKGLPGTTKPVAKMYFADGDQKMIAHMQKADKLSSAAAQKKYWDLLPDAVREARLAARRA